MKSTRRIWRGGHDTATQVHLSSKGTKMNLKHCLTRCGQTNSMSIAIIRVAWTLILPSALARSGVFTKVRHVAAR